MTKDISPKDPKAETVEEKSDEEKVAERKSSVLKFKHMFTRRF